MGSLEDIKTMRQSGKTDLEIKNELQTRGIDSQEAMNLIAQSRIREAVTGGSIAEEEGQQQAFNEQELRNSIQMDQDKHSEPLDEDMQPSILAQPRNQMQEQMIPMAQESMNQAPMTQAPMTQEYYPQGDNYQGQYYQPYQQAPASTDSISEIAEQIVNEQFGKLSSKLADSEKSRAIMDTKLSYIDERLKRIEKIIDKLQLSILQKVGEYVTNVEDIKREVIETQKTFKAVLNEKKTEHNKKSTEHHK